MRPKALEPELNQPIPRPVRYRDGCAGGCGIWFVRLFILPHTIAGAWLLLMAVGQTLLYLGVLLMGVEVEGRITGKSQEQQTKGVNFFVEYKFITDGDEHAGRVGVAEAEHAAMNKGDSIPVRAWRWWPESGHWVRAPGEQPILALLTHWVFAVFWNGILSVFLWMAYFRPWAHCRLLRRGTPTTGIVREVKAVADEEKRYCIRYEYAVPAGHQEVGGVLRGKQTRDAKAGAPVNVGDLLTVLYDPRRPRRHILYQFSEYRVASAR